MNTTGIQNYLSNVFRPIVTYDTGTSNFTPKLELSNIDTYSGNVVSVIRGDIGDSSSNVYVGVLSGNSIVDTRACSRISAFGWMAGSNISNCSNSVYIGAEAGNGSVSNRDVISIGYQSGQAGAGVSNIFIGTGTRSALGSSNIFLGHAIDLSSVSNQVRIGYGSNTPFAADLLQKWVGIGGITSPYDITYSKIDLSGNTRVQGNFGLNVNPGARTLDVNGNFRVRDSSLNTLDFSNGLTSSSGGFASIQSNITAGIGNTTIGVLKRGIINISAVDRASSANRTVFICFAYSLSNVTSLGSNSMGDTDITIAGSDIQISNTTSIKTYDYNITYFPLS